MLDVPLSVVRIPLTSIVARSMSLRRGSRGAAAAAADADALHDERRDEAESLYDSTALGEWSSSPPEALNHAQMDVISETEVDDFDSLIESKTSQAPIGW